MNPCALPDSRGGRSITLTFVAVSWLAVTVAFLRSWLAPLDSVPPMGGSEYGMAVTAILAIWLGREWTEKAGGSRKGDGGAG